MAYIGEALRNCSVGGYVHKDSFNQVLAVLENVGFKRLRDTPLADRLFTLLDSVLMTNSLGPLGKNKLAKIPPINKRDPQRQKHCLNVYFCLSIFLDTFKAYDSDNDNRISRKEFIQFIEDSWKAAFRILAENCDGKSFGRLGLRDLETFAAGKVSSLNEHSGKLFSKLDSTKKGVHIHSLSSSSSKLSRSSPLAPATTI